MPWQKVASAALWCHRRDGTHNGHIQPLADGRGQPRSLQSPLCKHGLGSREAGLLSSHSVWKSSSPLAWPSLQPASLPSASQRTLAPPNHPPNLKPCSSASVALHEVSSVLCTKTVGLSVCDSDPGNPKQDIPKCQEDCSNSVYIKSTLHSLAPTLCPLTTSDFLPTLIPTLLTFYWEHTCGQTRMTCSQS